MLIIGSHVHYNNSEGLISSVNEAISYGANTFMLYTGAPQNTIRRTINISNLDEAYEVMRLNNININNVIAHAPYIVNPANGKNEDLYNFSLDFLISECKRCETLGITKLVVHPGSHVGLGSDIGISKLISLLNKLLSKTKIQILIETMAGKGNEIGINFLEIKQIIDGVEDKSKIGICLDTCHLSDAGYDISNFDSILDELEELSLLEYVYCIHINDSKNIRGAKKDRHENIGFGNVGFDNLIKIIYNSRLYNVPKILETPYVEEYPPYKFEIEMIKEKVFDSELKEKIIDYYNNQ